MQRHSVLVVTWIRFSTDADAEGGNAAVIATREAERARDFRESLTGKSVND